MVRKIGLALTICFITSVISICSIEAELVDRIVAVVNDEPVTQSELDALLIPIYEQYRSVYSGQEFVEKMNEARLNILNQLIEDRLIAQESKRLGVKVTEEEVSAQIEEVKRKFQSQDAFKAFLTQQGISLENLRKRYKEQIAIRKLHHFEVRQKVVVSPLEIEQYYESHLDDFTEKEKLKVKTIMIKKKEKKDDVSTIDEAQMMMEKIVAQLKEGAQFSELAKQYSEGMHAEEGGSLGFIKRGEMIVEFDDVLFDLSVGELSPILETDIGYHIFFVEAKQEKKVRSLSENKDEIQNIIFRTKSKERFEKWMKELKENAYISIK